MVTIWRSFTMRIKLLLIVAPFAMVATVALAKDNEDNAAPPTVFQAVLDCKSVPDPTERLACYDKTVESMATASRQNELVVADRETMKEARKGLFGLGLPKLKLFGGSNSEEVNEIESTIASFRSASDGFLVFTLADGALWKQIDGRSQSPKEGDKVRIRKAAMGSFLAKINDRAAIRVKRLAN
jgi:hypothetical protein